MKILRMIADVVLYCGDWLWIRWIRVMGWLP